MICGRCGAQNDDKHRFCISCGNPVSETAEAISAAVQATASVSAASTPPVFDKLKETAKSAVDTVVDVVSEKNFSGITSNKTLKSARNQVSSLWGTCIDWLKRTVALKAFKRGVAIAAAIAIAVTAGFGVFAFAGRDILQIIQGEEDYARSWIVSHAEEVVFQGFDAIEQMAEYSGSSGSEYQLTVIADVPEDAIDDFAGGSLGSGRDSRIAYELLRVLGASRLDLTARVDSSSKKPAMSVGADWKVKGKAIANADATLLDNELYISAPQLYDDVIGLDFSSAGLDGVLGADPVMSLMNAMLIGNSFSSSIAKNAESIQIDKMMTKLKEYTKKMKPVVSKMLKQAVEELDISVEHGETVDINDSTAQFDAIVITATERDIMRAFAAALDVAVDEPDFISVLSSITKDLSSVPGMEYMSSSEIKSQIKDTVDYIESSTFFNNTDTVEIIFYVNGGNAFRGFSVMQQNGGRDNASFVFKPGVGYEAYAGDSLRVYGDMKLGFSLKGDVNVFYSDGGMKLDGKVCDYSLSGGMKNYNIKLGVKASDLIEFFNSGDLRMFVYSQISDFEDIEASVSLSGSGKKSETAVTLTDSSRKAKLSVKIKSEINKKVKIPDNFKEKVYNPYELMIRFNYGELTDNLDEISDKLESMGFDVGGIVDELMSGIRR